MASLDCIDTAAGRTIGARIEADFFLSARTRLRSATGWIKARLPMVEVLDSSRYRTAIRACLSRLIVLLLRRSVYNWGFIGSPVRSLELRN